MTSFRRLYQAHHWREIPRCPGRFVATDIDERTSLARLLGPGVQTRRFNPAKARDTVLVAEIDGGGVISYLRADGTYLHTLNTPGGFRRKLADLGIAC